MTDSARALSYESRRLPTDGPRCLPRRVGRVAHGEVLGPAITVTNQDVSRLVAAIVDVSLRLRPRQPRPHALDNPAAFELGDGPENVHLQLAHQIPRFFSVSL